MLDFATLKFSTNQSGHVTILRLSDRLNLSVASIEAEKNVYRIGSGLLVNRGTDLTAIE